MSNPSLPFLADSIAHYLLEQLDVKRLPVPVREILEAPPKALTHDLSLSGGLALGVARWIRLLDGQGIVFVNGQSAPRRAYSTVCNGERNLLRDLFKQRWTSRGVTKRWRRACARAILCPSIINA